MRHIQEKCTWDRSLDAKTISCPAKKKTPEFWKVMKNLLVNDGIEAPGAGLRHGWEREISSIYRRSLSSSGVDIARRKCWLRWARLAIHWSTVRSLRQRDQIEWRYGDDGGHYQKYGDKFNEFGAFLWLNFSWLNFTQRHGAVHSGFK